MILIEAVYNSIYAAISKWLAIDYWYKLGMGTSLGGFTLSSIIPDQITLLAYPNVWDKVTTNPVTWSAAFGAILINVIAAWQKVRQDKRDEEKHEQDLKQQQQLHEINLNKLKKK